MLIGLDFDNTLAGYDHVFSDAAREHGFIQGASPLSKTEVRTHVLGLKGGEKKWMALQGEVYGKRMHGATLMPGAGEFLSACKKYAAPVVIVSHKTEYGHYDNDRVNLREAAMMWMTAQGFFDADGYGLNRSNVFFESTRTEKINRIAQLGCTWFVDDLVEVFQEPGFPENVSRILYDASGGAQPDSLFERHADWQSIERAVFGR